MATLVLLPVMLLGFNSLAGEGDGSPAANPAPPTSAAADTKAIYGSLPPNNFKQFKEDLFKPFNFLDPRNTLEDQDFMDGKLPGQRPASPLLTRRYQALQDEKRNWAFTAYEELYTPADETAKKLFGIKQYGDDGRERKELSVMDRYYESLGKRDFSATNRSVDTYRAEFIIKNGFDPLGTNLATTTDPFMKKMLGLDTPDSVLTKSFETSLPSGPPPIGSAEEVKMEQKRLANLRRRILGEAAVNFPERQPGVFVNPFQQGTDNQGPKPLTAADALIHQQMAGAAESRLKAANPWIAADPTANALHSRINDDLTARALGYSNPLRLPTNTVVKPAPTAQSISAEWDPFGANRTKPKF